MNWDLEVTVCILETGSRTTCNDRFQNHKLAKGQESKHGKNERKKGQTTNNIWKNGTFIMSVILSNIFPLKRITRSRHSSCFYNNYNLVFKKKKKRDTFSHVTSYQTYVTSLGDSLRIVHGTIFRNSMGEGTKQSFL
jgi:hypothetical protein